MLVCLIGICLIALLLLRKKLSSEEQIAAPLYEEVGLSGNDIQLEPNGAYGKVYIHVHSLQCKFDYFVKMVHMFHNTYRMHAGC